jgi:hypothetical protein
MSAKYVQGVQSQNVMATVKHYILNNQETLRNTVDSVVDERTLHEIYLPPFKSAIKAGIIFYSIILLNDIASLVSRRASLLQVTIKFSKTINFPFFLHIKKFILEKLDCHLQ